MTTMVVSAPPRPPPSSRHAGVKGDRLGPWPLRLFPEGAYVVTAPTLDGGQLQSTVMLSQVMAARPGNIVVNGVPSVDCEAAPFPKVSAPVLVDWDPVTTSRPEIGESGPVEIVRYQFFVQQGDVKFGVDLPPTVTEFQVPSEIIALGGTFKFEMIARAATLNNTAVGNCFTVH